MINVNYKLTVSSSPHAHAKESVKSIMRDVVIALIPAAVVSVAYFGMSAMWLIIASVAASVFFEYAYCRIMKKPVTIGDFSAVITGILIAFNVPAGMPIWMVIIGDFIAIIIVKEFFGGLGQNFVNPALAARIILMVSFPKEMTSYPLNNMAADAVTTATPLTLAGTAEAPSVLSLFAGYHTGCLGEICAAALVIGFIYLLIRKVLTPVIPACYLGTVALIMLIAGRGDFYGMLYQLLSGGLLLGALFMATDYVTSPVNFKGRIVYGVGCGLLTCLIRLFGSSAEGVSFSIIIMNILVPHIEKLTRSKVFGEVRS
ncbi:MAG: RnfABCDGE type electron transport complex subunit D [Lachnospiraceae bacterium]|nr:RnfABCDGE type electron transport complex subunit D [Lachnospiraceae bacterium]